MPSSSAAVRSLALALLGLGASQAFAQGANVTAFNPYSGIGLPDGPTPSYGPQAAYPIVDTVGPSGGPAFNPWQSAGVPPSPGTMGGAFNPAQPAMAAPPAPGTTDAPGSHLPAPPRGALESRIVAIPERGDVRIPRDLLGVAPTPPAASPPAPVPAPPPVASRAETMPPAAAPTPTPTARPAPPAVAAAPAPAPAPAAAATPAPTGRGIPITTPSPDQSATAKGATVATIPFAGQSADLSDDAKSELDRIAKNIGDKGLRQVELRAFASGAEPDSRKIALARALVVRSYLIDKGVKSRIEVGAFAGDGERVDIVVPGT
jgi:outer membrane protein OmpA-like peptidoglycan-associated protein